MGGRGRGQAPRLKAEQFGLTKEDVLNSKAPPEDFPLRQPTFPPAKITEGIRNTLDVGLSMKEEIRCRVDTGKFTPCLAYPSELDGKSKKKKKKSKSSKSAIGDLNKHLEELGKSEDKAAENSDAEQDGDSGASSSGEEEVKDSDDSNGSESNDDEMDVGNDYYQVHDNDDDEDMGPPSEDEEREAMA